jgi:hypothetical protein
MTLPSLFVTNLAIYNRWHYFGMLDNQLPSKSCLHTSEFQNQMWLAGQIRARICKRLWSPGINSARLGIDSWAPEKVYKYGLSWLLGPLAAIALFLQLSLHLFSSVVCPLLASFPLAPPKDHAVPLPAGFAPNTLFLSK